MEAVHNKKDGYTYCVVNTYIHYSCNIIIIYVYNTYRRAPVGVLVVDQCTYLSLLLRPEEPACGTSRSGNYNIIVIAFTTAVTNNNNNNNIISVICQIPMIMHVVYYSFRSDFLRLGSGVNGVREDDKQTIRGIKLCLIPQVQ
jgi:hypothetical protein